MSVERKVDTEKIRQNAKKIIDEGYLGFNIDSTLWIEPDDISYELINNAGIALKECMYEIEESTKNLNDYLNSVADAFEAKDAELAKSISEASIDAGKSRVSRIANNPVFNNTYYD